MRRLALALLVSAPFLVACPPNYVKEDRADKRAQSLSLTHAIGGTHWCALLEGDKLYAGFGTRLLVLDPMSGQLQEELQVLPLGASGAIVDITRHGSDLIVVMDRTALVRVDTSDPRDLVVTEIADAESLGILPTAVSSVDGDLWISGFGGVVRAGSAQRYLASDDEVGRVVRTSLGVAAPVGRSIKLVEDGKFVGSATALEPYRDPEWLDEGFVFRLQGSSAASVGLMGPDLRERVSVAVEGAVSDAFFADGRLWVVTPTEITHWLVDGDKISDPQSIAVKGAVEVTPLRDNYLFVSGTFGRAVYRIATDASGKGDEFLAVSRSPGRIDIALGDRRRVLASSPEGTWQYTVGDDCELVNRKIGVVAIPRKSVEAAWGKARISTEPDADESAESGKFVIIDGSFGKQVISIEGGSDVRNLELIDGDLWICHDHGLAVLRATGTGMKVEGAVRIPGPVLFVFPRTVGGGASYVSALGGMGLCEWVRVGDAKK